MDARKDESPRVIRLADYRPPPFLIDTADLEFDLDDQFTEVTSRLAIRRNPGSAENDAPLVLDGEDLELIDLAIDGRSLAEGDFRIENERLIVDDVADAFVFESRVRIRPQINESLMGLYKSGGNFCTQCEAEGFRKITWFADRPDVLSTYTVSITADPDRYPVLLSNGNQTGTETLPGGRRRVTWHDPWPKPTYLFALVAGDLDMITDTFTTRSGRQVELRVYSERHNIDQCGHAMASLKKAMAWDEEVYGREYDLDIYMIVAVDDFNMGAMENKGLNVFNTKYVLARPDTATDGDFQGVEGVIAHEYFHNWSGNRVTCRDWFQLSLKEGFTVFRDQEFSADVTSRGVKRIEDVNILRTHQFREDAGPMAHPVRPESYMEINNFYTVTVYNKGAEVVRMIHNLLGEDGFRAGCDLYFSRHDGQAVTTEDFVRAMEDSSGADLRQFRRWYDQAGTPVVEVEEKWLDGNLSLTLSQHCPATPGQEHKAPFHIPVVVALLDDSGKHQALNIESGAAYTIDTETGSAVLELKAETETWRFTGLDSRPLVSLLRGFSAPVSVRRTLDDAGRAKLMALDTDPFNRWDAAQSYAVKELLGSITRYSGTGEPSPLADDFTRAWDSLLTDGVTDKALIAAAMRLPSEMLLAEEMNIADPDAIHVVRTAAARQLAAGSRERLVDLYHTLGDDGGYRIDAGSVARRSLRNTCLAFILELDDDDGWQLAERQFENADNMTDSIAALSALVSSSAPEREALLDRFYQRWKAESLVVDKWLMLQATARSPATLDKVGELMRHPAFNIKNPNKVRSLIGAFAQSNPVSFHRADGAGYRLVGDMIKSLDGFNPQVAARLAGAFLRWRKYDDGRQETMRAVMREILDRQGVSRDVAEIIGKSLG